MENTVKNTGKEKSDMLTMLENLERMFDAIRYCVNERTRDPLLMAIAIEAETLALKMEAMYQRWCVYLPFKENSDVDFQAWKLAVSRWITVLDKSDCDKDGRSNWFSASYPFLLDLYAMRVAKNEDDELVVKQSDFLRNNESNVPPIKKGYFLAEVMQFVDRIKDLLNEMENSSDPCADISLRCQQILEEKVKSLQCSVYGEEEERLIRDERERVERVFGSETFQSDYKRWCNLALNDLLIVLELLNQFFNQSISNDMFERFSIRVSLRYLEGVIEQKDKEINQWRNFWPKSSIKIKAKQQVEIIKNRLRENQWGQELEEYINLDDPSSFIDANLGRFLFKNRRKLEKEDMYTIALSFLEMLELDEILHPKEEKVADQPSQPRKLNKVEQQILDQLMDLAEKGNWTQGATVESIQAGMKLALGVGDPLPEELLEQSDQLWWLFQNRPVGICNDAKERRIMITWLNIAGWCVKKGILKGGTDNDICKRFFPNCGDKDYMNVSRGRKDSVKTFIEIYKLLETCLLPK